MAYQKTNFISGVGPAVDSVELNKLGQGIVDAHILAENAKQIVPVAFTKDPVSFPDYVPWKRTDFPTDTYRIYVGGRKYPFNLNALIGNTIVPPHVEGYIYNNGTKYVDFNDYHNNQSSGTSSNPENPTFVQWGSTYVQLTLRMGTINTTDPYNNAVIGTTVAYDLSAIKEIKIDWQGDSSRNDTDFPIKLKVGSVKEISHIQSFARRIDTLDVSNVFSSQYISVELADNANWKGANTEVRVYSIQLVPFP